MNKIPYRLVDTWQEAREIHPDQPVILVWVRNNAVYMRYHGKFHVIYNGPYSYGGARRWRSIAGVWFTDDSAAWIADNSIALPFSAEDFMLYQLTWGDWRE